MIAEVFAVIGTVIVVAMVIAAIVFLYVLKFFRRGMSANAQTLELEDARLIQDIHHGLARMEERIEALETILLERSRKEQE